MSQGKYRWPTPHGDVSYPDAPIPVIVDYRPLPRIDPAPMRGLELARAEDAVFGKIVLVRIGVVEVWGPVEHWVPAGDVRRT